MKNIPDEILNDYIDNSLDIDSVNKLNEELRQNNDALVRFKALKIVDSSLKNLPVSSAPSGFTDRVMEKIQSVSKKYKYQLKRFMSIIFILFGFLISAIIITALYVGSNTITDFQGNQKITQYVTKGIEIFNSLVSNDIILTVVSTLTLISLLSVYILIDSHRNLKNKLKNLSSN